MLISYRTISGTASRIWLTGSVPGVRTAARMKMTTMACRRYFRMNAGVRMPSFERNQETIGSSNTTPAASITLMMKLMYSLIAMLFSIVGGAEAGEELQRGGQHHEIGEGDARQETERREEDDRPDVPPLLRHQARGDERPELIEEIGDAQDDAADDRDLHIEEKLAERLQVLQMDRLLTRQRGWR